MERAYCSPDVRHKGPTPEHWRQWFRTLQEDRATMNEDRAAGHGYDLAWDRFAAYLSRRMRELLAETNRVHRDR